MKKPRREADKRMNYMKKKKKTIKGSDGRSEGECAWKNIQEGKKGESRGMKKKGSKEKKGGEAGKKLRREEEGGKEVRGRKGKKGEKGRKL